MGTAYRSTPYCLLSPRNAPCLTLSLPSPHASGLSRAAFFVLSLCALASLRAVAGPEIGRDPATKSLSIFSEVFSLTRSNYVEPIESSTLLEGAYDGMSDALDPFSYYVRAASMALTGLSSRRALSALGSCCAPRRVPVRRGPDSRLSGREGRRQAGRPHDTVDGKPSATSPFWKVKAALEGPRARRRDPLFRGGDERRVTFGPARLRFEPAAAPRSGSATSRSSRSPLSGEDTGRGPAARPSSRPRAARSRA